MPEASDLPPAQGVRDINVRLFDANCRDASELMRYGA